VCGEILSHDAPANVQLARDRPHPEPLPMQIEHCLVPCETPFPPVLLVQLRAIQARQNGFYAS